MLKKINILLIILFVNGFVYSQFGIKAGYEYCRYNSPFYNIQIAAYNFNTLNPNVSNNLKVSRTPGGLQFGMVMGNKGFFEIVWHNYHGTDRGKYTNGGVDTISILKHRMNYTSFAVCIPITEDGLSAGWSLDYGIFKVLKKKTSASAIDTAEFVSFYSNYSRTMGFSVFLNLSLRLVNGISLNIRPSYHWLFLLHDFSYGSNEYYTNVNNFGVEFFVLFGGSAKKGGKRR
ncbi:MAG: hypothetical protein PHD97_07685 [Bacteroidales bacterium]|nr:hypothetical protein [Bacteroidales bacterium]